MNTIATTILIAAHIREALNIFDLLFLVPEPNAQTNIIIIFTHGISITKYDIIHSPTETGSSKPSWLYDD